MPVTPPVTPLSYPNIRPPLDATTAVMMTYLHSARLLQPHGSSA